MPLGHGLDLMRAKDVVQIDTFKIPQRRGVRHFYKDLLLAKLAQI